MAYPEKWLKAALEASGVAAFPLVVPEGIDPPFIVYARSGTARERDLTGSVGVPVGTFQIDIYADGYLEVKGIADIVRGHINDYSGTSNDVTIQWSHLADESDGDPEFFEGRDRPTYLVQQVLEITWEE